jgi:hypothetical protein
MAVPPPNMEQRLGQAIAARSPYPQNRAAAIAAAAALGVAGNPPAVAAVVAASGGAVADILASVTNPCIGLMVRFYAGIEQEEYYPARTWEFQGTAKRIGKAIRIPYHYADENGNLIREHILVGFEGSGSD